MDPHQHPLKATAAAISAGTQGERHAPRESHMQSANEGPADIIAKVCGAVHGGKRADDGPCFTNNEAIPILDPCGSGAFGYFECTEDVTDLTKAGFLSTKGEKTPAFVRFSTVTFGREFPDQGRNPHGFAIKYHFIARHGQKVFTDAEAVQMCGEDLDYSKRDLWDAIENGEEIEWVAKVQVMQPNEADPDILGFDPFDVTKVWPRDRFPMKEFSRLVLNKNPENFHCDVEQAAFSPGSMVPGIEDSPDPLLQFRMFFYKDAQYHRTGVNLHQIPVNCPFMAQSFASLNFDGAMRVDTKSCWQQAVRTQQLRTQVQARHSRGALRRERQHREPKVALLA